MIHVDIIKANITHCSSIAQLLAQLGQEVSQHTGAQIQRDKQQVQCLCEQFINQCFEAYVALYENKVIGYISFYESFALYANGRFMTVTELFVSESYRSQNIGQQLLSIAKHIANQRNYNRIELTTPPLPAYQRSVLFYQREGFEVTGGRKMKFDCLPKVI